MVGLGCFLGSCNVGLSFEMYTPCSVWYTCMYMYMYICRCTLCTYIHCMYVYIQYVISFPHVLIQFVQSMLIQFAMGNITLAMGRGVSVYPPGRGNVHMWQGVFQT